MNNEQKLDTFKGDQNSTIISAIPTRSGNGFKKGQEYLFKKRVHSYMHRGVRQQIYTFSTNIGGAPKTDSLVGKSTHLWDGENWDKAGHFDLELIKEQPLIGANVYY